MILSITLDRRFHFIYYDIIIIIHRCSNAEDSERPSFAMRGLKCYLGRLQHLSPNPKHSISSNVLNFFQSCELLRKQALKTALQQNATPLSGNLIKEVHAKVEETNTAA